MIRNLFVTVVITLTVSPALAQFSDQPECRTGEAVPNPAVNCPDRLAWQKFVEVVTPVRPGVASFQTWATDGDVFQCPPADLETCHANPQAQGCPVWPVEVSTRRASGTSGPKNSPKDGSKRSSSTTNAGFWHRLPDRCLENPPGAFDLIYRNRANFDYIFENGLWYVEGLETAFQNGLVFNFPVDTFSVKANWFPLDDAQAASGRYFTMEEEGSVYGMVSLIIATKDLPNWSWVVFEHVDNLGRCDFIGCHDSFGVEPAEVPPRYAPLCELYPPGELTPAARKLLAPLPPVFQHYRLKGTQEGYVNAIGSPVLLGSSVSEAGFVATASCMTCHSRASVLGFVSKDYGLIPYFNIGGFRPNEEQSFYGTPDPSWFTSGGDPKRRWALQTDFNWGIPLNANSIFATQACCDGKVSKGELPSCQCQSKDICIAEK